MSMTERTTVRLPSELLRRAKRKAAQEGVTLTSLIEEGLRQQLLQAAEKPRKAEPPPVSTVRGKCLVDLDRYARIADIMDEGVPLEKLR
jgi:hypothetical protein